MWRGALGMIDALGFKGIWKREAVKNDADAIFAMFEEMEKSTQKALGSISSVLEAFQAHGLQTDLRTIFLSDTIVIGVQCRHPDTATANAIAVGIVGTICARIQGIALKPPVPLMYRGCISFGEFKMADRYIVGPAVDEAAEWMNAADAALIWCTPSAAEKASLAKNVAVNVRATSSSTPLFFKQPVPFKGGRTYETWVVSPFQEVEPGAEHRVAFLRQVSDTFTSAMDHEIKRQNTLRILGQAHEHLESQEKLAVLKERREARERAKAAPEGETPG